MRRSLWRDMAPGSLALRSANRRRLPWWERHRVIALAGMWVIVAVALIEVWT